MKGQENRPNIPPTSAPNNRPHIKYKLPTKWSYVTIALVLIAAAFIILYSFKYLNHGFNTNVISKSSTSNISKTTINISKTTINKTTMNKTVSAPEIDIKYISINSIANNSPNILFSIIPLNTSFIVSPGEAVKIRIQAGATPVISYYNISEVEIYSIVSQTTNFTVQAALPLYFALTPIVFNITVYTPNSSYSGYLDLLAKAYYIKK